MNSHPTWLKFRSNSVPPTSDYLHIRPKDLAELVDIAVKLRMRAKKQAIVARRQKQNTDGTIQPHCLMPRLGIVDDKPRGRIFAKLEIPDVDPNSVKLTLRKGLLTVSGERQPYWPCVPAEYQAGLAMHSQTMIEDQRPRIIMLGGGRVTSMSVPRSTSSVRSPQYTGDHITQDPVNNLQPASMACYNELRYGPFRRDLRVSPGITAKHISAMFQNGMLLISWPKVTPQSSSDPGESSEVIVPITSNPPTGPLSVKIESVEV